MTTLAQELREWLKERLVVNSIESDNVPAGNIVLHASIHGRFLTLKDLQSWLDQHAPEELPPDPCEQCGPQRKGDPECHGCIVLLQEPAPQEEKREEEHRPQRCLGCDKWNALFGCCSLSGDRCNRAQPAPREAYTAETLPELNALPAQDINALPKCCLSAGIPREKPGQPFRDDNLPRAVECACHSFNQTVAHRYLAAALLNHGAAEREKLERRIEALEKKEGK